MVQTMLKNAGTIFKQLFEQCSNNIHIIQTVAKHVFEQNGGFAYILRNFSEGELRINIFVLIVVE